jgi:hypothetical protein
MQILFAIIGNKCSIDEYNFKILGIPFALTLGDIISF